MPKVKRVVTETSEVTKPSTPEEEGELHVQSEEDLWDHVAGIKPEDWRNRSFYIWQIEPPITKKEGEPAYVVQWQEPFTPEMLSQRAPEGKRFKIMEKVTGRRERPIWFIAMVPRPGQVQPGAVTQQNSGQAMGNDTAQVLRDATNALKQSPQLLDEAARKGQEMMSRAYTSALETVAKPVDVTESIIKLQTAGIIPKPGAAFDWKGAFDFFRQALPLVKDALHEMGFKPQAVEKAKFGEMREMLEFLDEVGGLKAGAKSNPWLELAPKLLSTLETVSGNVARSVGARQAPPGVPEASNPAQQPTAGPNGVGAPPAAVPAVQQEDHGIQNFIKHKIVEFFYKKDEVELETVAVWIEMTAPDLASLLRSVPKDQILPQLKSDSILGPVAADPAGSKFFEDVIDALVKVGNEA
jgi:hypothetical protein